MRKVAIKMNILFCGNDKMEEGLFLSSLSLKNNIKEPLHIYVLTIRFSYERKPYFPVSNELVDYLDTILKQSNPDSFVKLIDITELFAKQVPLANLGTRFTPCCMLRLYADKISELPDKILYLDTDILCRRDISELYHEDMTGHEIAGVPDHYGKWLFHRQLFKFDYINSGVLLMNLKLIRKTGLLEKCREKCVEKKMFMPDQSALNELSTSIKLLPRKFNEQKKLKDDTVLQHFTTTFRFWPWLHSLTVKPWQIDKVHNILRIHEYDDLFDEYTALSINI